jgi:Immunity protein 26
MRQKRAVGAVLAVSLGDGTFTFALTLPEADFAVFDARTDNEVAPKNLLELKPIFRVAVHKSAWSTGRWRKVAKVSPNAELLAPNPTYIEDRLRPGRFQIYAAGAIRSAARAECMGLESASVWDPEHVEDRIRSFYKGESCPWVTRLGAQ